MGFGRVMMRQLTANRTCISFGVVCVVLFLFWINTYDDMDRGLKPSLAKREMVKLSAQKRRNYKMIQMKDGYWTEVTRRVCSAGALLPRAKLHTPTGNTNLSIYEPIDDKWVSGRIFNEGSWELDLVIIIFNVLRRNSDWVFIDIGANIGVYTVSMAKAGRSVLAIEPVSGNLKRLCQSLRDGEYTGSVEIIANPVSDSRRYVSLGTEAQNVGGTFVRESSDPRDDKYQTILLDDLIPKVQGRAVVIKMDVEKHEPSVLKGAEQFFNSVDVRYLLMEYQSKNDESGKFVLDFMHRFNMTAVIPGDFNHVLNSRELQEWPNDVMWIKYHQTT